MFPSLYRIGRVILRQVMIPQLPSGSPLAYQQNVISVSKYHLLPTNELSPPTMRLFHCVTTALINAVGTLRNYFRYELFMAQVAGTVEPNINETQESGIGALV